MAQISEVTADFLYIRWEGDRKKVKRHLGQNRSRQGRGLEVGGGQNQAFIGKKEVFGYFGKYYSGYPPSDIAKLKSLLNSNQTLS